MNINEYHKLFRVVMESYTSFVMAPKLVTNSGLEMSVQASAGHYSQPRLSDADYYSAFEIGFPSERVEAFMPYAEDENDPTETVYGYVPASLIDEVIQENGGVNLRKSLENFIKLYNKTQRDKKPKYEISEIATKNLTMEEVLQLVEKIKG